MREVDAVVDDRHHQARAAGRHPPRFGNVHVDVPGADEPTDRLARVVQGPLLTEQRLAGGAGEPAAPILRLHREHVRLPSETGDRRCGRRAARCHQLRIRKRDRGHEVDALRIADGGAPLRRDAGPVRDDQPAGGLRGERLAGALRLAAPRRRRRRATQLVVCGHRSGKGSRQGEQP
jgi:hypothetical protein